MSETRDDLREALARAIFERGRKQGGIDPETWEVAGDEMQAWLLGHADAMIAGPFAPILAQVSALQAEVEEWRETFTDEAGTVWRRPTAEAYAKACVALQKHRDRADEMSAEVERLQKVEGEREKGRVTSSPCWSDKPEPQSVSALRATITSRRALELVTQMVAAEDRHVAAVNTLNAEHRSQSSRGIFPLKLRPEQIECDAARKNWYDAVRNIIDEGRQLVSAFAPCDQSGEAGETEGLDPQGESTVTGAARQAPSDNPLTKTKEGSEHV